MKTLSLYFLLAGFIFLNSCSKSNDDKPQTNNSNLTNKWKFIRGVEVDSTTGYTDDVPLTEGSYVNFDKNGICYSSVDGTEDAGNWNYINNNSGVYIQYIATFDYSDVNFNIVKLDDHNLVLASTSIPGLVETLTLTK